MAAIKPQPHVANLAFMHPTKHYFKSRITLGQGTRTLPPTYISFKQEQPLEPI